MAMDMSRIVDPKLDPEKYEYIGSFLGSEFPRPPMAPYGIRLKMFEGHWEVVGANAEWVILLNLSDSLASKGFLKLKFTTYACLRLNN